MIYQGDYINFNSTGIYKITNIINGKFYIGSAISFRTRYNQHLSKLNLKNIIINIYNIHMKNMELIILNFLL